MSEDNPKKQTYPDAMSWKRFIRNWGIMLVISFGGQLGFRYFNVPSHLVSLMGVIVVPPLTYIFWRGVQQRDDAVTNADGVTLFFAVMWLVLLAITLLSWPR